jgi:hypothetical protein
VSLAVLAGSPAAWGYLAERPAGAIGLNHDDLQGIGHGAP